MPPVLRSRVALIVLLGAFLIPIGTSSLRGLTHILTCRQRTEIPFTLNAPGGGSPTVVSSSTLTRGTPVGACGGLVLDLGIGVAGPGKVRLSLPITNNTPYDWRGTVKLRLGHTVVPIDIGEIRHGQTAHDSVTIRVPSGQLEVKGSLLIGP